METKKKKYINEDVATREMLDAIREASNKFSAKLIKEEIETNQDAIAITNDPKFGQQVLKQQEQAFRTNVDSGAQFAKENSESVGENPLIFIPSERKVIFSGTIPSLNNLKFQYVLNDSENIGIYLWVGNSGSGKDYLRLTDNTLKTLQKVRGYYDIWQRHWNESSSMFDSLIKDED